jgi:tetratricopeptide (TPR) repeat protein
MRVSPGVPGVLLAACLLAACGRSTQAAEASASTEKSEKVAPKPQVLFGGMSEKAPAEPAKPKGLPVQLPPNRDPALLAATQAFEHGDLAAARLGLMALGEDLDCELLRARLAAAQGDEIDSVRRLEAVRSAHPDQARFYATAAEIHAAAGRLKSAEEEVRKGLETSGPCADLSRARGVLALARPGGARVGLNHLLDARTADPDLPFVNAPLAEAHLLLGRQAMADKADLDAVGHARASLLCKPGDREARLLLADALTAVGQFDEALVLYETLLSEGAEMKDALARAYKQAGTAALLEGKRDLAVERALRARELGLPEDELGFGATLMEEEAQRVLADGTAALEKGEVEHGKELCERALRLDPDSIPAKHFLASAQFRLGAHAEAARLWREVLDTAHAEQIELPDPVHLNLARALYLEGRTDEVRTLLEAELQRDPEGKWAAATRELLERLDEEQQHAKSESR